MTTRIKLNYSLEALRSMRAELVRLSRKEYQTRGYTRHYKNLLSRIEKLDAEIKAREEA